MKLKIAILAACVGTFALAQADIALAQNTGGTGKVSMQDMTFKNSKIDKGSKGTNSGTHKAANTTGASQRQRSTIPGALVGRGAHVGWGN